MHADEPIPERISKDGRLLNREVQRRWPDLARRKFFRAAVVRVRDRHASDVREIECSRPPFLRQKKILYLFFNALVRSGSLQKN